VFKIFNLGNCSASPMEGGRGEQIKLINSTLGTEKLDVHLNRLAPGGPAGKLHHHNSADNVYIVKRGEGTLIVEDKTYIIREDDVVFNPRGNEAFTLQSQRRRVRDLRDLCPCGAAFRFCLR